MSVPRWSVISLPHLITLHYNVPNPTHYNHSNSNISMLSHTHTNTCVTPHTHTPTRTHAHTHTRTRTITPTPTPTHTSTYGFGVVPEAGVDEPERRLVLLFLPPELLVVRHAHLQHRPRDARVDQETGHAAQSDQALEAEGEPHDVHEGRDRVPPNGRELTGHLLCAEKKRQRSIVFHSVSTVCPQCEDVMCQVSGFRSQVSV